MKNTAAVLLFLTVLLVGGILLQIFLSKRTSRWPGLILPAITFLYALLMLLSVAVYAGMTAVDILVLMGSIFLLGNIPTAVLLGIYFACREGRRRRAQLDKMSIQDLE